MSTFNRRLLSAMRLFVFAWGLSMPLKYVYWRYGVMPRMAERAGTRADVQDTTPLLAGGWAKNNRKEM